MVNKKFAAVILAGGMSTRMGSDKALLQVDGITLLDRAKFLMEELGANEIFVSRNEFKDGYLPDIYPGHGPLSGIHAALFHTELPLLILPVDMPLIDVETLAALVNAGLAMQIAVQYEGNSLPLFIPNTKEVKNYLERCLTSTNNQKSSRSIKRLLTAIGSAQLTTPNKERLVNTNTPQEWEHCTTLKRIIDLSKNT